MDRYEELEKEISRLKDELAALKKRHSFMMTALENLPNPIFIKDEGARFLFFNKRYSEVFGMTREEYLGKSVLDLDYLPMEDRKRYQAEDTELIRTGSVLSFEVDFDFADGEKHPSFYWSRGVHDDEGGSRGLIGEIVDISKERDLSKSLDQLVRELRQTNLKLKKMAEIDAGTGIFNRTLLNRKSLEMEEQKMIHVTCALMADLDHFKRVNDLYGHIKGDEVLSRFAAILQSVCRDNDIPIRYGGEEFLLFLNDATLEVGKAVAERIRKRCEEEIKLSDGSPVTVSIGVSLIDNKRNLQENIAKLDHNLYLAKASGRNRIVSD